MLERRKKLAEGSKSLFVFPGSGETGHLVEPRAAWERMRARSTALGLVEALAYKATAKTFDYQLAREEAIDFPVRTIERYTPLAEKHGLHLKQYEMRDCTSTTCAAHWAFGWPAAATACRSSGRC